ncbi:MAG: hypothetical protein KAS71_15930 [Bacteroidales bacterium]|nr:hypothetical protein [Bacteroidales bacterium]
MKNKLIILTAILSLIISSCIVRSIHPFYKDSDVVFKSELLGTWLDSDSSKWVFSQRIYQESFLGPEKKDNSYEVVYYEEGNDTSYFYVHLFMLKGEYYLDFFPDEDDNIGDKFASFHFFPTHSIARIKLVGDENLSLFWYDEGWLGNLFEENRVKISHEYINPSGNYEQYILTAETSELQKFIVKYGAEIDIFEKINFDSIRNIENKFDIQNTIIDEMEAYCNSEEDNTDVIYLSMIKIEDVE